MYKHMVNCYKTLGYPLRSPDPVSSCYRIFQGWRKIFAATNLKMIAKWKQLRYDTRTWKKYLPHWVINVSFVTTNWKSTGIVAEWNVNCS